jgi:hypothetical protein
MVRKIRKEIRYITQTFGKYIYKVSQYVTFPTLLLPHPSQAQISSLAPYSCNTLGLCSTLTVVDQVSHPHKTKAKIIVPYNLTLIFLDSKMEDK